IEPVIIGCIMPLLPGVAFTTAVRDAISDELISGISRAVEALLMAVALATGIGVSLSLSYYIGGLL
ncbi:MAG: threonine/serine exporter family protein, partial [Cellulosilyticum sp.]|nr:threonine/serine exporter family protein [Cellulosilyticum sp.]